MYKVIVNFTDLQDNNYKYLAGDVFPRKGLTVSESRLKELSTDRNRRGKPIIEKVIDEKPEEIVSEPTPKKGGKKKVDAE